MQVGKIHVPQAGPEGEDVVLPFLGVKRVLGHGSQAAGCIPGGSGTATRTGR